MGPAGFGGSGISGRALPVALPLGTDALPVQNVDAT